MNYVTQLGEGGVGTCLPFEIIVSKKVVQCCGGVWGGGWVDFGQIL